MISIKSIDRDIGHESSVGVCFREEIMNISHRQDTMVSVMFVRFMIGRGPVGLVLVFAATRREMALRSVS